MDYGLVIPDESKTLGGGAVKPWQTQSFKECQDDLLKYAKKRGIPLDKPWRALSTAQKSWVIDGEPEWVSWKESWPGVWYGVKHYFDWLESKAYKMHIRVLLSRYRAYTPCTACEGSRLKPDALLWRVGNKRDADAANSIGSSLGCGMAMLHDPAGESPVQITVSHGSGIEPCRRASNGALDA